MSEQPTIRIAGDPIAQRDRLAAMAAEALAQRDRLLFTLGTVLGYFPRLDDLPSGVEGLASRLVPARRLREWWEQIHTLKSIDRRLLIAAYMASTATKEATQPARVRDLPCPKCGDADVRVRYCDGCSKRLHSDPCRHKSPEHFHRSCRRCQYGWQTDDALDARVVCES